MSNIVNLYYLDGTLAGSLDVSSVPDAVSVPKTTTTDKTNATQDNTPTFTANPTNEALANYAKLGGDVSFANLTITSRFTAYFGKIANWDINSGVISCPTIKLDGNNEKITIGNSGELVIDGKNKRVFSSNYVSGSFGSGFLLSSDLLEVGNISCRGIFRTAVFQKDIINVIAGSFVVSPNGDVLDADMTASESSTLKIKGTVTLAVGDILRIKEVNGANVDDEWLEVTDATYAPIYSVTRDKGNSYTTGANPAWKKGVAVVDYGQSGDGGIYMTASDSNSPYLSVYTHLGSPWSALTTHLRLGNLNGFLGYSTDLYGIAIGNVTNYFKYDPTNGVRIAGSLTILNPGDINTADLNNDAGWTSDSALTTFISGTYATDITAIQNQLDGVLVNYFYDKVTTGDTPPSLTELPASGWDEVDYPDHTGDLYYDLGSKSTLDGEVHTDHTTIDLVDASDFDAAGSILCEGDLIAYTGKTGNQLTGVTGIATTHATGTTVTQGGGYVYRWLFTDPDYEWVLVPDSGVAAALAAASTAQDTADGKRRVFTATPTTPYDVGDLWLTSLTAVTGDLKKCITAKATGSYDAADWVVATKYTDDTAANQAIIDAAAAQSAADTAQATADGMIIAYYQETAPHSDYTNVPDNATYNKYVGDLWYKISTTTTYIYTKTANGGNFDYAFTATTIPASIFDTIDGKRTVFTTTPTTPYYTGDLWLTSMSASTGDIKKCIVERLTGAYNAADWVIASEYTKGATWGTNLNNIPTTLTAPSGDGLYLSSTYMGFYKSSAWKTYIDNSGNFILGDIAGGGTGIAWNQATAVLSIKGSIVMTGGSISWAGVTAPDYTQIQGTKPPSNATYGATWGVNIGGSNLPASGATVGATWNSNISGQPSDNAILNSILANGSYSGGTFISGTTIYAPVIIGCSISAKSGSTIVATMNANGVRVNGQYFSLYDAAGSTIYGWIGGYNGYFNISSEYSRNILINAGSATIHLNSTCAPLNHAAVNLGYSNYAFGNVYSLNFAFSSSKYLNVVGSNIQSNSDFRVAGSIRLTGNLIFENNASITIGSYVFYVTSDPDYSGKYYLRT